MERVCVCQCAFLRESMHATRAGCAVDIFTFGLVSFRLFWFWSMTCEAYLYISCAHWKRQQRKVPDMLEVAREWQACQMVC